MNRSTYEGVTWLAPGVIGRLPARVRDPLLTTNLWIGGVGGGAIVLASGIGNPQFDVWHPTFLLLMSLQAAVIGMALWRRGPYLLRSLALGALCAAWGAVLLAYVGPAGAVYLFLLMCTLLGGSLYGLRGFVVSFAAVVALFAISAYGWSTGALPLAGSFRSDLRSLAYWGLSLSTFLCGAVMISGMLHFLLVRTAQHLAEEVRMAESLALEQRLRAEAELTRLREELARRQAETTLAAMLRAAPIGIALVRDGHLSLVNDRMGEMFGQDPAAMASRPLASLFQGPGAAAIVAREIAARFGDGQLMALESAACTQHGKEMWVSITAIPLDPAAPEAGMVTTFSDITASRRSAELLREREERLREIFDHTSEIIFSVLIEEDGRFIAERVNRAAANFGIDLDRVNAGTLELRDLFPEDIARRLESDYTACVRSRAPLHTQHSLDLAAGRFDFATTLVPILAPDASRVVRVVGMARDVTAERRTKELERARALADAANRAKSAFLAHMSHEIRTPLNAILGFARLLRREPGAPPAEREPLEIIQRNGEHLLEVINDILEISTIEAGRVVVRDGELSLVDLLESLRATFASSAAARQLSLEMTLSPGCPVTIQTDPGKLRQILVNLVDNALKFTAAGGIRLRAAAATVAGRVGVQIEIADTGIGMTADDLERLFQPFEQTEAGRRAGGTGLGLAISRSFARLLGGDLAVESRPGGGSTFTVSLPCRPPAARGAADSIAPGKPFRHRRLSPTVGPVKVLVVDDVPDNRAVLVRFLQMVGFTTQSAASGHEAIEIARDWQPRCILVDMRLPDVDAAAVVRALRAQTADSPLAIIGVSASVFAEDQSEFARIGVDAFLPKPFCDEAVLDCIGRQAGVVYEEVSADVTTPRAGNGAERPAGPEWLRAMARAAEESDYLALQGMIDRAESVDTHLASELRACLRQFDYDGIRSVLEREGAR